MSALSAGTKTILYPVKDLAASKAIFAALLGEPSMDQPYYVQFEAHGQSIGLDPNGHAKGLTGATPYWHVDDITASLTALVDAGAKVVQEPKEVGGGRQVASVVDSDGNAIGLIQDS